MRETPSLFRMGCIGGPAPREVVFIGRIRMDGLDPLLSNATFQQVERPALRLLISARISSGRAARAGAAFFAAPRVLAAASLTSATSARGSGSCSTDVIRRNSFGSTLEGLRLVQNTHPQCCLNAAVMQKMPRSST